MQQMQVLAQVKAVDPALAQDIIRVELICPGIAKQVKPGQFVTIASAVKHLLLPRPFTVYDTDGQAITLIIQLVGPNTHEYAKWKPGDQVLVFGPIGRQVVLSPAIKCFILVSGGVGLASLYYPARSIQKYNHGTWTILAAGFRTPAHVFGIENFRALGMEVCSITDDRGTAVKLFREILDSGGLPLASEIEVLTCGPEVMMRQVVQICIERGIACKVFMERIMACGRGDCKGCAVTAVNGSILHVCQHGPAIDGREVAWDATH